MARDVSGTYTRVSNSFSNPSSGSTISPSDADALFDDIESELTDSLSRSGKGGMSADLDMNNNDINEIKTAVFGGSTSGNTTVIATAIAGTTTLTLPAATDTLLGKATTDVLTNKTFDTAGAGNSLSINGVAATANTGTGAVARATSPTFVTPALGTPTAAVLTNATGLPLGGLTTQAAFTFVGNNTSGAAIPSAVDIAALTTKGSPAAGDYVMISDQAASGAWKKATVSSVGSAGSVSSIAGNTGAFTLSGLLTNSVNDLRVTAAVQADQETGTSTTTVVTPGVQKHHPLHPKAWAYVTQSGGTYTLAASSGVSGISKFATGRVDVTLSTAFSSTNYAAVTSCAESGAYSSEVLGSRTTTNCRVNIKLPTSNADADSGFQVIFYGDQ